jgi:hypothetical protein
LILFDKKFQKKKKKNFTCEFIIAAYFDLRNNKIPKSFDEKHFFFEKFCVKNETKNGTKNELFGAIKTCFFCNISRTNYENFKVGAQHRRVLKKVLGGNFFL